MRLDSLHDVRKEPLTLRNETILPHLVGDETDQVCREEDLLDSRRTRQARRGDLQSTDEAVENVLV